MRFRRGGAHLTLCVGLVGVFLSADPTQSAHGESKKVTGTSEQIARLVQTDIPLGGDPNNMVYFHSHLWIYRSSDPSWDRAHVFSVSFTAPAAERNRQRGHMAVAHPGGDLTFLALEGTWSKLSAAEWAWEVTGHFVWGTGRFAGITGRWRERSEWRMSGVTSKWEAEYDVR